MQAGVAFPADREPAEVVQPGERSFHHPAHAAESQAVVGAAADDHRFHASAPQLATVLVVVNSRDRRSQGRTATSWPSARATDVWRRPAPSSGSPWPPRKGRRPAPSAVTPGKRAQSPGKTRTPYAWPESREFPANRSVSDATAARLKIVVSPVRVLVSPSRVACKTAVSHAASPDARSAQTLSWAFSGLFSAYPTARRRRNAGDPTPSAGRLHARSRRDPATHRLPGPRASTARGDYEQLLASAQVVARPRGG